MTFDTELVLLRLKQAVAQARHLDAALTAGDKLYESKRCCGGYERGRAFGFIHAVNMIIGQDIHDVV